MGIFSKLSTEDLAEDKDVVGGGNFDPIPSGIYDATIKLAYAGFSSGGAQSLTMLFDIDGKEYKETIYITKKTGENFYIDKEDGKTKRQLPGFTLVNDICLLTTNSELSEQDTETKVVSVYNPDAKSEIPTEVEVPTALLGQSVKLAILRKIVNKQAKGDSGRWEDTDESKTENSIEKAMHHETGRTVNEYIHEVDPGDFQNTWGDRFTGKDINKFKGSASAGSTGTGRPGGAAASAKPASKKLFG